MCPEDRGPRLVYRDDEGWHGACDRHRASWRLEGEPPEGVPVGVRPSGCRDLNAEAEYEATLTAAGFSLAPVFGSQVRFWRHPDIRDQLSTTEALMRVERLTAAGEAGRD